jgi:hypothetical protein
MHEAFGLPIVSREEVETSSSQWNFFAFSITYNIFTASNNIPVEILWGELTCAGIEGSKKVDVVAVLIASPVDQTSTSSFN